MSPNGNELTLPLVYGTAFCIGPGIFLTAGHVVHSAQIDGGVPALLDLRTDGTASGQRALDVEVIEGYDIAVLKCRMSAIPALDWQSEPLGFLSDVAAFGFPYAIDLEEAPPLWRVVMRAVKGFVITRRRLVALPACPIGYEVSYPLGCVRRSGEKCAAGAERGLVSNGVSR